MRLLECSDGELKLTKDIVGDTPSYAVLSHTWGPDTEEVTFRDLVDGTGEDKPGYRKIQCCAAQTRRDGLRYFWVDTCCIDKSNNTELSTAINSMFRWYQNAARCYAYLSDIEEDGQSRIAWEPAFRASQWFTRGWTLQELLAPASVEFFTKKGQRLGDKKSLEKLIHEITGIAVTALRGSAISQFDVEERFRWAEARQTTLEEDWVYSLLGLFEIFMPLIYGEGKAHALRRLRREIAEAANSNDTPGRQGDSRTQTGMVLFEQNLSAEQQPENPPQPFATIPFCRDADFVSRGDILDRIRRRYSEPAGRVALVGLGGVGKSQLAIEIAYQIAEEATNTWVFWVHAGTQARVEEGFRTIADVVKLPGRKQPNADKPQLVYDWLNDERSGRWVIVIDSADDGDVFYGTSRQRADSKPLATYLPQSRNGFILITTRDRDLARRLTGSDKNIVDVGPMVQADALSLLEKKLGPFSDVNTAIELVRLLDCVPLAISQAAGYIRARAPRSSLEKYLDNFREGERKRIKLLGYDGGDLRRDGSASNAILTTWQISFEYIRSKRPSAADLLSLMSFFDRQGIPESVLKPSPDKPEVEKAHAKSDMMDDSESDSSTGDAGDAFEDDLAILRDYCLITPNEHGDVFEMHGLVQLSTRKWLEIRGLQENFKQQFVVHMAAHFPTGAYDNWATCQKLFAHVEIAADYRVANCEAQELWAGLLHRGAWYAWMQGSYDVAERMARKAQRAFEKRLTSENENTIASTSLLAIVLRDKGLWGEAEKLFLPVLETCKTKLGADHDSTLSNMAHLASTYRNQGRWDEAEKLFVQLIEIRKIKVGADHPDTLRGRAQLASTYRKQGRWEESEKLFVQVIEICKMKLGDDHPDTLISMANLASTFEEQNRLEEAEKLNLQVMEIIKTKFGADHPDTLAIMSNLATNFYRQGRWKEAEVLGVQVMETRRTKLGPDHPNTLDSMNNLAFTFRGQGRHAEALALMKDCAEARRGALGPQHPSTLSSLTAITKWGG